MFEKLIENIVLLNSDVILIDIGIDLEVDSTHPSNIYRVRNRNNLLDAME